MLNDRVRQVGRLNTEIADWLQVRMEPLGYRTSKHRAYAIGAIGATETRGVLLQWLAQTSQAQH